MRRVDQDLGILAASLTEMEAAWMDDTAAHVIKALSQLPEKEVYTRDDVDALLRADFGTARIIIQLFLGISKDAFNSRLPDVGIKRYRKDPGAVLDVLENLGVSAAMTEMVNRPVRWSDLLVERLKEGRGRAMRGQARGRSLEDFIEVVVERVFGAGGYDTRCSFVGRDGKLAKADFAIPAKNEPRIVIAAKGYGATGSKQTDVLGDLRSIIDAKRHDTTLLFVTDGLTWRQRMNDLRKIVALQNAGEIARIYTRAMVEDMEADLRTLRQEHNIV